MCERIDKTKPVPAPPGLKWTIHRSVYTGAIYDLLLWPETARVDQHGMGWSEPLKKSIPNFRKGCTFPRFPLAHEFIEHERQFYRRSKRALKQGLRVQARQQKTALFMAEREVHGG